MRVKILTILVLILGLSSCAFSDNSRKTEYADFNSYKTDFMKKFDGLFPIFKIVTMDVNADGISDNVLYGTQGEEEWIVLLVSKKDKFVEVVLPVAEENEIVTDNNLVEFKVGFGTFPVFGNPEGSDKYCWYDFYKLNGTELVLNNAMHIDDTYREMLFKYKKRIKEIEDEISKFKKDKSLNKDLLEHMILSRQKHIDRYKEFIDKAVTTISTIGDYTDKDADHIWILGPNDGKDSSRLILIPSNNRFILQESDKVYHGLWKQVSSNRYVELCFNNSDYKFDPKNNWHYPKWDTIYINTNTVWLKLSKDKRNRRYLTFSGYEYYNLMDDN